MTQLEIPFTKQELRAAVTEIHGEKAPGPDGFPLHFYQRHWDICGDNVTRVVLKIVRGEESPEGINDTVLVLIPKVKNPTLLSQFQSHQFM